VTAYSFQNSKTLMEPEIRISIRDRMHVAPRAVATQLQNKNDLPHPPSDQQLSAMRHSQLHIARLLS
jgi:hypothetical protein